MRVLHPGGGGGGGRVEEEAEGVEVLVPVDGGGEVMVEVVAAPEKVLSIYTFFNLMKFICTRFLLRMPISAAGLPCLELPLPNRQAV